MPSNSEVCDVVVGRPETRVTVLYRLCRQRALRENERERQQCEPMKANSNTVL
jgi:hypothetical protein